MDVKAKGNPDEIIHVPTPSQVTNSILEFVSAWMRWPMVDFDVVAAFPHAKELDETILLDPPAEWEPTAEELEMV